MDGQGKGEKNVRGRRDKWDYKEASVEERGWGWGGGGGREEKGKVWKEGGRWRKKLWALIKGRSW